MKFEAKLIVVGTKPEIDWVGKRSSLLVKFSGAENHNVNVGTTKEPKYETKSTSWFNFEAWEEVAKKLLEAEIDVGTALEISGIHKIDKVQEKNEKPRYYSKYIIRDFSVYESRQ